MFAMIDDKTIILLFLCYLSNANLDFISTFCFSLKIYGFLFQIDQLLMYRSVVINLINY